MICTVPEHKIVMRDNFLVWSVSATVRLSILYPRPVNNPTTRAKTPGSLSTIMARVWERIGSETGAAPYTLILSWRDLRTIFVVLSKQVSYRIFRHQPIKSFRYAPSLTGSSGSNFHVGQRRHTQWLLYRFSSFRQ